MGALSLFIIQSEIISTLVVTGRRQIFKGNQVSMILIRENGRESCLCENGASKCLGPFALVWLLDMNAPTRFRWNNDPPSSGYSAGPG